MSGNPPREQRGRGGFAPCRRGGGRGDGGGRRGDGGRGRGGQQLPFHPRGGGQGDRGGGSFRGQGQGQGRGGGGFSLYHDTTPSTELINATVTGIENEIITTKPKKQISFPHRPAFGSKGSNILLYANFFEMASSDDCIMHRHDIKVIGKTNPTGKKLKRVVQLFTKQLNMSGLATDFKSNIITKDRLNDSVSEVVYFAEDEDGPSSTSVKYQVELRHTGSFALSQLVNFLKSSKVNEVFDSKEDVIQMLNIVLGYHAKSNDGIGSMGANKHFSINPNKEDLTQLGAGLLAIRGFFTSVRAATGRLVLNIQVKNIAVYESGYLHLTMLAYLHENKGNFYMLENFLKKVSVNVTHIKRKNSAGKFIKRIKPIQGLANINDGKDQEHPPRIAKFGAGPAGVQFYLRPTSASGAPESSQTSNKKMGNKAPKAGPSTEGRYISVFDFFKETYNITLQQLLDLPVLRFGTRENPVYIPAEVCMIEPGQPAGTKLTPAQTQQMIKFAVRRPDLNAMDIARKGPALIGSYPPCQTLNEFGLSTNPQMVLLSGRILTGPAIRYAGQSSINPERGSWNMRNIKFATKVKVQSWRYFLFTTEEEAQDKPEPPNSTMFKDSKGLKNKVMELQNTLRALGIEINDCGGSRIPLDPKNMEKGIDETFASIAGPKRPQLVFSIIKDKISLAAYKRIKINCDIKHGFHSICVLESKFFKSTVQYHANVGLKFNLKLGGINHNIDRQKLGIIKENKTMIIGIDVTHPGPGTTSNAPSVAGMVASVDQCLGQWPAELRIQKRGNEEVETLEDMLKQRLKYWKNRNNNALPENIIVYRDGVSEGQYQMVLDKELPALQNACAQLYPPGLKKPGGPKFTVIIVSKRHNTRFYPAKQEGATQNGNTPNGTVVDRNITEARHWDFFLQSHSAIQGTARPTHYYVVYDEIFRDNRAALGNFSNATDALEDLTHNMCYLYGRATKAVRVAPPVYYADLACERARKYLGGLFEPETAPAGSSAASVSSEEERANMSRDIRLHDSIRTSMFYI